MTSATLDALRRHIRELPPDQLRQIRDEINRLPVVPPDQGELQFVEALRDQGLLVALPVPDPDAGLYSTRRLARVTGEPVSETLVRERR